MGPKIDFWSDFLDVFLGCFFFNVFVEFFHVLLKLNFVKIVILPKENRYF